MWLFRTFVLVKEFSQGYVAKSLLYSYNTHNPQSFPQDFLCKTRGCCHFPQFPPTL